MQIFLFLHFSMHIFLFLPVACKNKNDPVWIHCRLNEQGVKVYNYCGKNVKGGGYIESKNP